MKKRTKKKIHNRIIKKLISGQTLSGFDKKYHEEMIRKVYVTKPKRHVYADDKLVPTIDEEQLPAGSKVWPSIETTIGGLTYSSRSFSTENQLRKAIYTMRWNNLKDKVKGWFGK